jgi:hypothetical protein
MSKFDQLHLRWRGQITGPFTWLEIERKLDAHEIGLLHDIQQNNSWTSLGEYLAGRGETARVTVPVAAPPTAADMRTGGAPPAAAITPKLVRIPNRWVFIGLGILFGFLGLHDFYAHHWIRGALLLGISALFIFLDWGIIWPWLWAIGEVILTKLDGKRRRMPWTQTKPPKPPSPFAP